MTIRVKEKEIPTDAIEAKRWWRKTIKHRAAKLSDVYRLVAAELARFHLCRTEAYKQANTVMLYFSVGKELITTSLLRKALKDGKRVCLPRCVAADLEVREFGNGRKLVTGAYGIAEPGEDAALVKPEEIDLVVLPCVSCDKEGRRLGHGAGYYDRFGLKLRKDCKSYALCYGKLLAKRLPEEEHDLRVDAVITERRVYYVNK